MGQAKRRLEKMQARQPWCVYCGGTTRGISVDHMPPITVFTARHRLKGMEYLACDPCHAGTRPLDQLAGLLCRMYPDAETPAAREEVVQVLRGVRNNFPGLLEEMQPSREQDAIATAQSVLPNVAGTLNISDRVHALMARFAARVGLALHFELCGETLPVSGGVFIKWYTNSAIVDREIDQSFLAALGDPKTLRQGRQSLEDQFEYSSLATETGHMSTHFVAFRASFAVQAFAARDIADLAPAVETPHRVFRPGFLKIPYQSIDPG